MRFKSLSPVIGFALCALCTLACNSARADLPLGAIFEGVAGRHLLSTPEVGDLLARLAGTTATENLSREELLAMARSRLSQSEYAGERAAIEDRLRRIQDRFYQTPAGKATRAAEGELTRDEKLWINSAASHELRLNPEWRLAAEGGQNIEFFKSSPSGNYSGSRSEFIRQAPDPALADNGASTPAAERPSARTRVQRFFEEMKTCVRDKPPADMMKINFNYMLTQLMTDEAMTVGGAIVAAGGVDDVDWKTLPYDLAFEGMASLGDSIIATMPNAKFSVRWFRMQGFGVAQSSADAVLYYISPAKDTHGASSMNAAAGRFAYNTGWNTAYAPFSIALYDLIAGLKCLNVNSSVVMGIQVGAGLGANVAYFGLRNRIMGPGSRD